MAGFLIKNGTVVDGTGAKAFAADVRIEDDKIIEIGAGLETRGERVFDATGCIVSPGFIESHTHFDGTMWWQPDLDPLPGYGATTVILGNCGFSAAPVSDDQAAREEMVKIFSFFEDIPEAPFIQNLPWNWRKWSEYRQSLTANIKVPTNYGIYVGHIAIRLAVMGLDAWTRVATPEEISAMADHLDDALAAGALGMSDNLHDHDGQNRPIPTLIANDAEFAALFDVLERYPGRTYQVILDTFMRKTAPQSLDRLARLLKGKKVRVQLAGAIPALDFQKDIREIMEPRMAELQAEGYDFWSGFSHVSPTNTLSLERSLIFAQSNDYVWHEVVLAATAEEKMALLRDPDWRARARDSWDNKAWKHSPLANPDSLFLRNSENGFGPVNLSLKDYAASLGVHHSDAMAEWILANGLGSTVHMAPFPKDEELTAKLIRDPMTVGNISDAGAHLQMFCGGGENILIFTKYVREGLVTLEEAVHALTGKLAEHFNLNDRGIIRAGMRADMVVFKLDEIERREEYKRFDVPTGNYGISWRYTRDAAPMRLTLVNGMPTFMDGRFTGAMAGRFISPEAPQALAQAAE